MFCGSFLMIKNIYSALTITCGVKIYEACAPALVRYIVC